MKLGGGWSRLAFAAQVAIVSLGITSLPNCSSSGSRPPPEAEKLLDAGAPAPAASVVSIEGADPTAGIIVGEGGFTDCGAQAPPKTITLRNPTSDIVEFKATMVAGKDFYKVNPAEGGIPARGFLELQIVPQPIPTKSDVVADQYAGTLELRFPTLGTPPSLIRVHQTARGAIIKTTVNMNALDFGDVRLNTNGTIPVSLTNSGNAEATVSYQVGSAFFQIDSAGIGSARIAADQTASKVLTFRPTAVQAYTDTLALSYNAAAVHCEPPPGNVTLRGKGTTAVAVTPGTLNFGDVDCGDTAAFQQIEITSPQDVTVTPTLGDGPNSPYTLANGAGAAISQGPPGFQVVPNVPFILRVVPKAVPRPSSVAANALGDVLTLTTSLASTHQVTLTQTAKGAIFDWNPVVVPNTGQTIILVNSGNAAAPFTLTPSVAGGGVSPASGTAAVGNTVIALTRPIGQLSVGSGGVLCRDVPGPAIIQ